MPKWKCDHPTCKATTEFMSNQHPEGWSRKLTTYGKPITLCPEHSKRTDEESR